MILAESFSLGLTCRSSRQHLQIFEELGSAAGNSFITVTLFSISGIAAFANAKKR